MSRPSASRLWAIDTAIADSWAPRLSIRTFVHDGTRWIIDYKLSQPAEGESDAQFMQPSEHCLTAPNSGHYATLYRSMQPNPVRCALYFPQIPMFIELEAE